MEVMKRIDAASTTIPVGDRAADGERVLLEGPHSRLKELLAPLLTGRYRCSDVERHVSGYCVREACAARTSASTSSSSKGPSSTSKAPRFMASSTKSGEA
jgi:hypothetical protein